MLDLSDASITKIADVLQRVAARVATAKPGEWVSGSGWDEGKFAERRYLTAADLDKSRRTTPYSSRRRPGHYGVANSYALKMAEVRAETQDPPAGTIDRDRRAVRRACSRNRRPGS